MYQRSKIIEKIRENENVYTLKFKTDINVKPGQFAMVWIPGVDEIPLSFSYVDDVKGFTFRIVGNGTRALGNLNVDDYIYFRGPYGTWYTDEGKSALFMAGGTGIASIAPFIEKSGAGKKYAVLGGKSIKELFFIERIKNSVDNITVYTEDGSFGEMGIVTDGLLKYSYDVIYACGPEKMIKSIMKKSSTRVQASLERIMKCGIGICDSCSINGYRVCRDGPVFKHEDLIKMEDLGKYSRTLSGKQVIM